MLYASWLFRIVAQRCRPTCGVSFCFGKALSGIYSRTLFVRKAPVKISPAYALQVFTALSRGADRFRFVKSRLIHLPLLRGVLFVWSAVPLDATRVSVEVIRTSGAESQAERQCRDPADSEHEISGSKMAIDRRWQLPGGSDGQIESMERREALSDRQRSAGSKRADRQIARRYQASKD